MDGILWLQRRILTKKDLVCQQASGFSVLNEAAFQSLELSPISIVMHPKTQELAEMKIFGSCLWNFGSKPISPWFHHWESRRIFRLTTLGQSLCGDKSDTDLWYEVSPITTAMELPPTGGFRSAFWANHLSWISVHKSRAAWKSCAFLFVWPRYSLAVLPTRGWKVLWRHERKGLFTWKQHKSLDVTVS